MREGVREALPLERRLRGDGGKRRAFFFGLNHAERNAVDEEQAIAATGLERDLAEGDAAGGGGVEGPVVLDGPARGDEEGVDFSRAAASGFVGARSARRRMTPSGLDAWGKDIGQVRVRQSANRAEIGETSRLGRDRDPSGDPGELFVNNLPLSFRPRHPRW